MATCNCCGAESEQVNEGSFEWDRDVIVVSRRRNVGDVYDRKLCETGPMTWNGKVWYPVAAMIHRGGVGGGHWTCVKKIHGGRWFYFDDAAVQEIASDDVLWAYLGEAAAVVYSSEVGGKSQVRYRTFALATERDDEVRDFLKGRFVVHESWVKAEEKGRVVHRGGVLTAVAREMASWVKRVEEVVPGYLMVIHMEEGKRRFAVLNMYYPAYEPDGEEVFARHFGKAQVYRNERTVEWERDLSDHSMIIVDLGNFDPAAGVRTVRRSRVICPSIADVTKLERLGKGSGPLAVEAKGAADRMKEALQRYRDMVEERLTEWRILRTWGN
ncbi:hypothetical protein PAPYR_11614 [Paratrimastix pyriformis]|uniref:USP domain-containing protein n=1 Tax=Paratrimastix pyriformis TaxID=342808 RepID=A0ABQ8U662_9EUKA|nr:hypothetical protein PAPYR_11614 [Paratrimastix pyriformis]